MDVKRTFSIHHSMGRGETMSQQPTGAIALDASQKPHYAIRIDGQQNDADVKLFIDGLYALMNDVGEDRCYVRVEIGKFRFDLSHVKNLALMAVNVRAAAAELLAGVAIVYRSKKIQIVMKAFRKLAPIDYPMLVTNDPGQADDWLQRLVTA